MTAAPTTPPLPGPRPLLTWWRELAPLNVRRLWFCPLTLHRLDAPVTVARPATLDPLLHGVLRNLVSARPAPPESLGLGRPLLHRLLTELESHGLLERAGNGPCPTDAGRRAADDSAFAARAAERRSFYFVDNSCLNRPAHFVHLNRPASPVAPPDGWGFDAGELRACVARSPEWKARHQFPADVLSVADASSWKGVIVDHPEQATLVLALTVGEGGGESLHGFTVRTEGWSLFRDAPLLTVPDDWRDVFPDLAAEPTADERRRAWLAWSVPRGVPEADAATCELEGADDRLRVRAAKAVVDRLRAAKGDPLKHEMCVLVGETRARRLTMLEIEAPVPADADEE